MNYRSFRISLIALLIFAIAMPGSFLAAEDSPVGPEAVTAATAAEETPPPADTVSAATEAGAGAPDPNVFGLTVPLDSHRILGYASGGILLASGVLGVVRYFDLKTRSHAYRTDDELEDECSDVIKYVWGSDGQILRWGHVGTLVLGESLYLYDALTGISIIAPPGKGTAEGALHRNAFFLHAGMMVGEIILGFLTTDALSRGAHDQINLYGAIHAGLGVAIPTVIIGSGLMVDLDLVK